MPTHNTTLPSIRMTAAHMKSRVLIKLVLEPFGSIDCRPQRTPPHFDRTYPRFSKCHEARQSVRLPISNHIYKHSICPQALHSSNKKANLVSQLVIKEASQQVANSSAGTRTPATVPNCDLSSCFLCAWLRLNSMCFPDLFGQGASVLRVWEHPQNGRCKVCSAS